MRVPIFSDRGRNGNSVAVGATPASPSITFFDPITGQATGDLAVAGRVLAFDLDGTHLAMIEPPDGQADSPTVISVREVPSGAVVHTVSVPGRAPYPRSRLFAVTSDLTGLLVGDAAPAVLRRLQMKNGRTHGVACGAGHSGEVTGLGISADGRTLVSTGDYYEDGRRLAWDVATGAPVADVPPATGLRSASATSPDGTLEVDPQADDFVPYFDLRSTATGDVVRTFGPQPSRPHAFDFAPDGGAIASSSDRDPVDRRPAPVANVWTVATGALEQSVRILTSGPETGYQSVLFGDANHLFVAGYATTARWCRATGP